MNRRRPLLGLDPVLLTIAQRRYKATRDVKLEKANASLNAYREV